MIIMFRSILLFIWNIIRRSMYSLNPSKFDCCQIMIVCLQKSEYLNYKMMLILCKTFTFWKKNAFSINKSIKAFNYFIMAYSQLQKELFIAHTWITIIWYSIYIYIYRRDVIFLIRVINIIQENSATKVTKNMI